MISSCRNESQGGDHIATTFFVATSSKFKLSHYSYVVRSSELAAQLLVDAQGESELAPCTYHAILGNNARPLRRATPVYVAIYLCSFTVYYVLSTVCIYVKCNNQFNKSIKLAICSYSYAVMYIDLALLAMYIMYSACMLAIAVGLASCSYTLLPRIA